MYSTFPVVSEAAVVAAAPVVPRKLLILFNRLSKPFKLFVPLELLKLLKSLKLPEEEAPKSEVRVESKSEESEDPKFEESEDPRMDVKEGNWVVGAVMSAPESFSTLAMYVCVSLKGGTPPYLATLPLPAL